MKDYFNKNKAHNPISQIRRELMLKVTNDNNQILPIMFHLHNHYPTWCDFILQWLITNKLIGADLLFWIKEKHKGSPLNAIAFILSKIRKGNIQPIIFNKDFFA